MLKRYKFGYDGTEESDIGKYYKVADVDKQWHALEEWLKDWESDSRYMGVDVTTYSEQADTIKAVLDKIKEIRGR